MKTLALLALTLVSCTGIMAREQGLMRVLHMSWNTSIKLHVLVGLEYELSVGNLDRQTVMEEIDLMTKALASNDRKQVLNTDWSTLRMLAYQGLDDLLSRGEIGPTVREILAQEIDVFNRGIQTLNTR